MKLMKPMCSFTVNQGDNEYQHWEEVAPKDAAVLLRAVIELLNMDIPIRYFTTVSFPGVNFCHNQVHAAPAHLCIKALLEIASQWEKLRNEKD